MRATSITIASADPDLFARCVRAAGEATRIRAISSPAALAGTVAQTCPDVLIVDLEFERRAASTLGVVREISPETAILVVGRPDSEDAELALFRAGAHGLCARDLEAESLAKVIDAIVRGEIWVRRQLVRRLLSRVAETREDPVPRETSVNQASLERLTAREHAVARLIGKGENNKRIARELAITERTVKAHLTEIFRKAGVDDRLKLALLFSRQDGQRS